MKTSIFACFVGLLLALNSARAVNYTWNPGSGSWATAAKWTPTGVPNSASDNATISSSDSINLANGTANLTVNTLTLNSPSAIPPIYLYHNNNFSLPDAALSKKLIVSSFINNGPGDVQLASTYIQGGNFISYGGNLTFIGTNVVNLTTATIFGGTVCFQGSTGIVGPYNPYPSQLTIGSLAIVGGTFKAYGNITVTTLVVGSILTAGCSPGQLTITGKLIYGSTGKSEFELGTPGPGNDVINVIGSLTLNGTIDVTALTGFTTGTYRLFNYTGALTNNGVVLGSIPAGYAASLDFSTTNRVNLIVGPAVLSQQSYMVDIHSGLNYFCNQLDHGSNTADLVLPEVPDGSVLYKRLNASESWEIAQYSAGFHSWMPNNLTLKPGEGAFLESPTAFTLTFTGTPHVPVLPATLPPGAIYLLGRQTNGPGTWDNIVGSAPPPGAQAYKWNGGGYDAYFFDDIDMIWQPTDPIAAVGEPMWLAPGGGSPSLPPANPFVMFANLPHQALGSATLGLVPNGLAVANLGSSGQDGVAIGLPNSSGFEAHWTDPNPDSVPTSGSFIDIEVLAIVSGQSNAMSLHIQEASPDLTITANLSSIGAATRTVQAFSNGVMVAQVTGQSGNIGTLRRRPWWKPSSHEIGWDDGPVLTLDWTIGGKARVALNGGPEVDLDHLVVIPEKVLPPGTFASVQIRAKDWPDMTITDESVAIKHSGLLHWTLGQAMLNRECPLCPPPAVDTERRLPVRNLGSSGQDGVSISLKRATALDLAWEDLDRSNSLPVGAYLEAITRYVTEKGWEWLTAPVVMTTHIEKAGTSNYSVSITHSNAATRDIEVWSGSNLVSVVYGQSGSLVAMCGGGTALDYHPETKMCTITWHGPGRPPWEPRLGGAELAVVQFQISGQSTPVTGNRLIIRPHLPPDFSPATEQMVVQVRASQIPEIVLTEDSHRVPAGGLEFSSVGDAKVAWLGTNGMDGVMAWHGSPDDCPTCPSKGVRVTLGGASGLDANVDIVDGRSTLPVGASLTAAFIGAEGTNAGSVTELSAVAETGLWRYKANLPAFSNTTYNVEAYLAGALVARLTNQTSGTIGTAPRPSGPALAARPFFDTHYNSECDPFHNYHHVFGLSWHKSTRHLTLDGGPTVDVDRVNIVPNAPTVSNVVVRAMELWMNGITNVVVESTAMNVLSNHVPVTAVGQASLRPERDGITVASFSTNGADGVSLALGAAGDSTATLAFGGYGWNPALAVAAALEADVTGSFNGVPGQALGNVRFAKGGAGQPILITADFSPIGAPTQLLVVRNNGVDVGVFPGHTGDVGNVSAFPIGIGKTFGQTKCIRGDFPANTQFLINGVPLVGDQLLILAENTTGHVDFHSAITLTASGVPQLTVTSVTNTPLSVGELHNAGLAWFRWGQSTNVPNTPRLTRADLDDLFGGIHDFMVGAGLNTDLYSPMTNSLLTAFQRRNMYYTDSGTEYFGYPVTTDDSIPYDLADMVAQGLISTQMQQAVLTVNTMAVTGAPPESIIATVSNTFLVQSWSAEATRAVAFGDTFLHSADVWQHGGSGSNGAPALKKWVKTALADAKGALEGAGTGAGIGTALPGIGTAAGAIGGAVIGGVAASVAAIAMPPHLSSVTLDGTAHFASGPIVLDVDSREVIVTCPVGWVDPSTLTGVVAAAFAPAGSFDIGLTNVVEGSAPGATLTLTARGSLNGVTNQPLGQLSITDTAPGTAMPYTITADFASISSPSQLIEVWNGTTKLASFAGHTGPVAQVPRWPDSLGKLFARTECYRGRWKPPIGMIVNGIFFNATELRILAESPTNTVIGSKTGFNLSSSGIGNYNITSEVFGNVTFGGSVNTPLGSATLNVISNRLVVNNIGSSGQDGVSIDLGRAASGAVSLTPMGAVPIGAFVQFSATGSLSGVTNHPLGYLRATHVSNAPAGYQVTADLSPDGSPTQRIEVRNNGVLLGTFTGHTGVVANVSSMPIGGGKLALGLIPPIKGCLWFRFAAATDIFIDGIHFVGDELRVLQESGPGVDYLSSLEVTAGGVPSITITQETVVPVPPILSFARSGGSVVITWAGGGTLQSSADLVNWSDVMGAVSPYSTPVTGTKKFFRVRQP